MSPAGREIAGLNPEASLSRPQTTAGRILRAVVVLLFLLDFCSKKIGRKARSKPEKRRVLLDTAIENHYQLAREQSHIPAI
jgi:hypothetical protein